MARERVIIPPRPKIGDAQKRRVHIANDGLCHVCGALLPVAGPTVQYDHIIPRALTGRDDDDALAPICTVPCHARKSARQMTDIAKARRLERDSDPATRKQTKRPLKSRTAWPKSTRPIQSRGFQPSRTGGTRWRPTISPVPSVSTTSVCAGLVAVDQARRCPRSVGTAKQHTPIGWEAQSPDRLGIAEKSSAASLLRKPCAARL